MGKPQCRVRQAFAQGSSGDIDILNYALTLEYLETAFYADVVRSGLFKGSDLETIRKFGREEAEHVQALTQAVKSLGGKPALSWVRALGRPTRAWRSRAGVTPYGSEV